MARDLRLEGREDQRRRAPSILFAIAGHGVAGVVFWFTFGNTELRPIWLTQFYVLLLISLMLMVYAALLRRNLFRIIALLNVMVIQIVLSYPEGTDFTVRLVIGTVFVVITMFEVEGAIAYLLVLGYVAALALNEWPLTVWGIAVPRPPLTSLLAAGAYFCFLAWLGGMVGSQLQGLERQREEIARLDRTVAALSNANLDFQEWGTRLQRATEEQERKRIAREIHDIVGHTLTNIQMMMEAGTDLVRNNPAALEGLLLQSRDQAQRGLLETRKAMRNLRAVSTVQPQGMRMIFEMVKIFENATKVAVELNVGNAPPTFGGEIDDVVYRMVQEGLTNAVRHGNASQVSVGLWVAERGIRVTIRDNGSGSKEVVPGVGLIGMTERLARFGGSLTTSSNHYGFSVLAEIPLPPEGKR